MQLEKRRQPMKIPAREFLNKQHDIQYIRTTPISVSMGFLFKGFQAMKFQSQGIYKQQVLLSGFLLYLRQLLHFLPVKI